MSEAILVMCQKGIEQALREEQHRAFKMKGKTQNIPIAYLFCNCGNNAKEKLLRSLIVSSTLSFKMFMCHFFNENPNEQHEKIEYVKALAQQRKEHPAVVLLEHLGASKKPHVTVQDLIEGLEKAHLYRIISDLEALNICSLSEHALSHKDCRSEVTLTNIKKLLFHPSHSQDSRAAPSEVNVSLTLKKGCRGNVLVTFVEDGRHYAQSITDSLGGLSYRVFALHDFTNYINEDFLKNIIWILSQVDFVIPILTNDYFTMLDSEDSVNSTDIDVKYAPYVARVLLDDWASSFKNKKLRAYKPCDIKWPSKIIYPPFKVAVDDPSDLPLILKKPKS